MSAVGTIPDNEDKRPPDIIADKQINRAATDPGTFAETPRPSLPQLPIVVPPNIEDFVRDVAVSTFRDLAKTITINGQNPEVTNQSVSFEIPTQPPASVQFAQMNPPLPPPQPAPVPLPQPTGTITTLQEMEASSEARNATKTPRQRNEEEMDALMARRLRDNPDYKPSDLASNEEKESFARVTSQLANPQAFQPTPVTPDLHEKLIQTVTPGATGMNWLAVDKEDPKQWDSGANRPVFGREENRLPDESRSDQIDREQKEYNQQRKQLKASVDALTEERPGQRSGEGVRSYTERTNEARLDAMNKEQAAAVRNGDSSYFYKGFIPILLTRKDGERKILARLDNTHSVVIEGAVGNERQGSLPSDDGYYLGGEGGGAGCEGFGLFTKTVGTAPNTELQVWVNTGLIDNEYPDGFTAEEGKMVATGGSGYVYAAANLDSDSNVTSTEIAVSTTVPNPTSSQAVRILGYYNYPNPDTANVTNYGCGSLFTTKCRDWYDASDNPYTVSLLRA